MVTRAMHTATIAGAPTRAATQGSARATPLQELQRAQRFFDDVVENIRRTYVAMMRRRAVRQALHAHVRDHQLDKARSKAYAEHSALVHVARQMSRLASAGATLEELLRPVEILFEHAHLIAGAAPRELAYLDLEEEKLSGAENVAQIRRRIHGLSPAAAREEAEICQRLVTINSERARALRLEALRLDAHGGVRI